MWAWPFCCPFWNCRIVFANRKRTLRKDEIVSKRFVLSEDAYFFGPLHCGKTRERYKEGRYPENMETVTVSNISMMETSVSFYFQCDHNATTFLLDPPDMTLQPRESKVCTCTMYKYTCTCTCILQYSWKFPPGENFCQFLPPALIGETSITWPFSFVNDCIHIHVEDMRLLMNNIILIVLHYTDEWLKQPYFFFFGSFI